LAFLASMGSCCPLQSFAF